MMAPLTPAQTYIDALRTLAALAPTMQTTGHATNDVFQDMGGTLEDLASDIEAAIESDAAEVRDAAEHADWMAELRHQECERRALV